MNSKSNFNFTYQVPPENVMQEIGKHLLLDGYDLVLDLQASTIQQLSMSETVKNLSISLLALLQCLLDLIIQNC
jgi:hypothetical protein